MKAFQHKSNLKHTAVLLFGIMMSCATVKAQDVPCLPSSFGETESQSAWCGIVAYTLHITGYGEGNGGWNLIASPLADETDATAVANLLNSETPENFDLYRFNQAAELEWENWKSHGNNDDHYHFSLESGRGYLYANAADVTLVFVGMPYSGNGIVTLQKTEGAELSGWNLVGNPFAQTAYVVDHDFYVMNLDGSEIIASDRNDFHVEPMEGIFVKTEEDGETMTFAPNTRSKGHIQKPEPEQIVINLSTLNSKRSTSIIDRAIVRFDESRQLPKFQIRENSTKIYIPQDGKDYAIVSVGNMGEIPLNFKASENGTYTLTISTTLNSQLSTLNFNYLHLIDNMTGADIDLLPLCKEGQGDSQPVSYTFTATTTDYESRFKLVFSVGPSTGSGTFAFYSNGNIIVNGEGTLQVIDIMGRVIFSCTDVARNVSTSGMTAGVYVLRLINSEDVKVQKMMIE